MSNQLSQVQRRVDQAMPEAFDAAALALHRTVPGMTQEQAERLSLVVLEAFLRALDHGLASRASKS